MFARDHTGRCCLWAAAELGERGEDAGLLLLAAVGVRPLSLIAERMPCGCPRLLHHGRPVW